MNKREFIEKYNGVSHFDKLRLDFLWGIAIEVPDLKFETNFKTNLILKIMEARKEVNRYIDNMMFDAEKIQEDQQ